MRAWRGRSRGSLLIVTLWLVTILGAMAVAIARYLSSEIRLTKYQLARTRAQALARSGVYLAMETLRADATAEDWAGETWALPRTIVLPSGEALALTITDEERRLNLNTATADQLTALLEGGADVAQAIVRYRDPATGSADDQPEASPPYFAKLGPIETLEELRDLPGMPAEASARLAAHATPHTGQAGSAESLLNLNTVSPEVLRALGVGDAAIEAVETFRVGVDGPEAHELDGVFVAGELLNQLQDLGLEDEDRSLLAKLSVGSRIFRVVSEATVGTPAVRVQVMAIVNRDLAGAEAFPAVLAWGEG